MKNTIKKYLVLLLTGILSLFTAFGCSYADYSPADDTSSIVKDADSSPSSSATENDTSSSNTINSDTKANTLDEQSTDTSDSTSNTVKETSLLKEDSSYSSKEDVATYIHTYGKLPENFITKDEAKSLGWASGSLEEYAPGKSIGGDYFGNYEGVLPKNKYHECDIDTIGAQSRGAKRIVYSKDGKIYYTEDHYKTFTLLYE